MDQKFLCPLSSFISFVLPPCTLKIFLICHRPLPHEGKNPYKKWKPTNTKYLKGSKQYWSLEYSVITIPQLNLRAQQHCEATNQAITQEVSSIYPAIEHIDATYFVVLRKRIWLRKAHMSPNGKLWIVSLQVKIIQL